MCPAACSRRFPRLLADRIVVRGGAALGAEIPPLHPQRRGCGGRRGALFRHRIPDRPRRRRDRPPERHGPARALRALSTPAVSFWDLVPPFLPASSAGAGLFGIVMFGSLLGLIRAPAAFLSALAALLAFELFFQLIYPGYYRHQSLFLCYLVAMYWLVAAGRGRRWPERWRSRNDGSRTRRRRDAVRAAAGAAGAHRPQHPGDGTGRLPL